jgi:ribosome-binding ATPase YchF (GTP1/OBG family)
MPPSAAPARSVVSAETEAELAQLAEADEKREFLASQPDLNGRIATVEPMYSAHS